MLSYALGVDYGTSNTVAMLRSPDGRVRQLLLDGSSVLSSAVYATPERRLLVGREAERTARLDPARFEPNPKRRIDEGEILLGAEVVPVTEVIAATLRHVVDQASRAGAAPGGAVTLTFPASWAQPRQSMLLQAAALAGMSNVRLVPEPVAAGLYFATNVQPVPEGKALVVYDLGAGTFDATVLRSTGGTFAVSAVDGLASFGGLDLDALVIEQIGAAIAAGSPVQWQQLINPVTTQDRRHHRVLWDDARAAKENLSGHSNSSIVVPLIDRDFIISRELFERAAAPLLQRTVELTSRLITLAGIRTTDISAVLLVGGATRMSLVSTMLHRGLGIVPTVNEQPELLVAEGALHVAPSVAPVPPPGFGATSAFGSGSGPAGAAPVNGGLANASPISVRPVSGSPVSTTPVSMSPVSPSPVRGSALASTSAPRSVIYQSSGPPRTSFPYARRSQIFAVVATLLLVGCSGLLSVATTAEGAPGVAVLVALGAVSIILFVVLRVRISHRLRIGDWGIRIGRLIGSELLPWHDIVAADVRDGVVWAWPVPGAQLTSKGKPNRRWRKKYQALFVIRMSRVAAGRDEVVAVLRRYRPAQPPAGYSAIPPRPRPQR